jgi:Ca2+-binding RTX toxin-like protein
MTVTNSNSLSTAKVPTLAHVYGLKGAGGNSTLNTGKTTRKRSRSGDAPTHHSKVLNGNDALTGLGGKDPLSGGAGDDLLLGGRGADVTNRGEGDDVMVGQGGDDELYGGDGNGLQHRVILGMRAANGYMGLAT